MSTSSSPSSAYSPWAGCWRPGCSGRRRGGRRGSTDQLLHRFAVPLPTAAQWGGDLDHRFSRAGSPPWAAMLLLIAFSAAYRIRLLGPPALGPVPDRPSPPNGWTPTTAP